jgi:hypothetical protein
MIEGTKDFPAGIHLRVLGDVISEFPQGRWTDPASSGHVIPLKVMECLHCEDEAAEVLDENSVVRSDFHLVILLYIQPTGVRALEVLNQLVEPVDFSINLVHLRPGDLCRFHSFDQFLPVRD